MIKEKVEKNEANSSLGSSIKGLLFILLLALIFTPIIIYPITFGFHLTSDHERWAQFGSYISGIYAPLLSLTTLLVLVSQSKMQSSMNKYQIEQAAISKVESHNTQYLEALCKVLESKPLFPSQPITESLKSQFLFISWEDIFTGEKFQAARRIYNDYPKVLDCWVAINSGLNQLNGSVGVGYKAALSNEKLRVQSILSFGTCAALDNFSKCLKVIPPREETYFSDIQPSETEVGD